MADVTLSVGVVLFEAEGVLGSGDSDPLLARDAAGRLAEVVDLAASGAGEAAVLAQEAAEGSPSAERAADVVSAAARDLDSLAQAVEEAADGDDAIVALREAVGHGRQAVEDALLVVENAALAYVRTVKYRDYAEEAVGFGVGVLRYEMAVSLLLDALAVEDADFDSVAEVSDAFDSALVVVEELVMEVAGYVDSVWDAIGDVAGADDAASAREARDVARDVARAARDAADAADTAAEDAFRAASDYREAEAARVAEEEAARRAEEEARAAEEAARQAEEEAARRAEEEARAAEEAARQAEEEAARRAEEEARAAEEAARQAEEEARLAEEAARQAEEEAKTQALQAATTAWEDTEAARLAARQWADIFVSSSPASWRLSEDRLGSDSRALAESWSVAVTTYANAMNALAAVDDSYEDRARAAQQYAKAVYAAFLAIDRIDVIAYEVHDRGYHPNNSYIRELFREACTHSSEATAAADRAETYAPNYAAANVARWAADYATQHVEGMDTHIGGTC